MTGSTETFYAASAGICFSIFLPAVAKELDHRRETSDAAAPNAGRHSHRQRQATDLTPALAGVGGLLGICALLAGGNVPPLVAWVVLGCLMLSVLRGVTVLLPAKTATPGLRWPGVPSKKVSLIIGAPILAASVYILVSGQSSSRLSGPFEVGGTCADRACGLRQHVAPYVTSSYAGKRFLLDGTKVYVRCQIEKGQASLHHGGHESNVWDLLADGRYVSDLFVNTPKHGELDPSIPRCPMG